MERSRAKPVRAWELLPGGALRMTCSDFGVGRKALIWLRREMGPHFRTEIQIHETLSLSTHCSNHIGI